MKVYIIGVGPGDPELLTLKGARLISEADTIVYAGSLIPQEVLSHAGPNAGLFDSAKMDLEQFMAVIVDGYREGKNVVRLHSGDPAIFGAILEQMKILKRENVEFEIVPGVSSFLAASAALKRELTVPGGAQSVILTRMAGRTPVPEKESMKELASHHTTMVIFLSSNLADKVQKELMEEYPPDTPVAIAHNVSRQDEQLIECRLDALADMMSKNGINKTALIIVEPALNRDENSLLYDSGFTHEYRSGK